MTFLPRSLAARIALLVITVSLSSSAAVAWLSIQSLGGALQKRIDHHVPRAAERLVQVLDHWYSARASEIAALVNSTPLVEAASLLSDAGADEDRALSRIALNLEQALANAPEFEGLLITNRTGEIQISVGEPGEIPTELLSRRSAQDGAARISGLHRLGAEQRMVQLVSCPLLDSKRKPVGHLHAFLDLERMHALLQSKEVGADPSIHLVDERGSLLDPTHAVNSGFLERFASNSRPKTELGTYRAVSNGSRIVGTHAAFPRFGWTLIIEQQFDRAFAPLAGSLRKAVGLILMVVVGISLVAIRIAGSIVRPLSTLSEAAERLSRGERNVWVEERNRDTVEFELLKRTFNTMSRGLDRSAQAIEDKQQAIERTNDELTARNRELSELNLILEQLSITDGLTRLHNHRYFQDSLEVECRRAARTGEPLSLLLVDVDHFKRWNDRLGHAGGDSVLRRLADVLNRSCREIDLLARYGGEEFALLATETDLAGAIALAEKLRQAVEASELVEGATEPITVSIGVASYQGDQDTLFARADEALYTAKDAGRNRVVAAQIFETDRPLPSLEAPLGIA